MIREIAKKLFNDEAGVSPIVATLVLIVVAIAGAAAVGTIMGAFSSDVSDSSSSEGAARGASTELLIAGSSTIQPVSEELAEKFMKVNPGVKVTVQAGGSGAGISSTKMDIVDIGSASEAVDTVTAHPELQAHQIGASAVAFVRGTGVTAPTSSVTGAQMKAIYILANNATGTITSAQLSAGAGGMTSTGAVTLYQRLETSGTEETASGYLEGDATKKKFFDGLTNVKGETGNAGVVAAMTANPNSIGFVDIGFAIDSTSLTAIPMDSMAVGMTETLMKAEALKTLKGDKTSTFPVLLTRPLNYLTNGAPSTLEKSFIDFAKQPSNKGVFGTYGYFSMYDLMG